MTTPNYCTFDGDPVNSVAPYVPTVADMGGASFVDDAEYPPIPEQDVMAGDVNQMQNLLVRTCRMMPKATFYIRKSGGTLTMLGFKSSNDAFVATDVELSVGDYYAIVATWPRNKLPVAVVPGAVTLIGAVPAEAGTPYLSQAVTSIEASVTVSLYNMASAPLQDFTIRIDLDGEGAFDA